MGMRITGFSHSISQAVGKLALFSVAMAFAGAAAAAQGPMITVLNPTGNPPPIQLRAMAPRPASLDGRTIYMVSNTFDNADKFCHSMQTWLADHMPNVKTEYRVKKGDYVLDDPDLWKEIKANNGMMVMAIGH
jgi:hypothetical protein